MPKDIRSLLNKFLIAKDEYVSAKLHFRYHAYFSRKKEDPIYYGCRYCKFKDDRNTI
jgi:hypothetical protein